MYDSGNGRAILWWQPMETSWNGYAFFLSPSVFYLPFPLKVSLNANSFCICVLESSWKRMSFPRSIAKWRDSDSSFCSLERYVKVWMRVLALMGKNLEWHFVCIQTCLTLWFPSLHYLRKLWECCRCKERRFGGQIRTGYVYKVWSEISRGTSVCSRRLTCFIIRSMWLE